MRLIKLILFSLALGVALPFFSIAQSSCVQNLRDARNFYDAGKLHELPKLLLNCIDNGFSTEEKVEALRLVTLSYLFDEEQEKAEASYLRLLKIEPEYQVNQESDPTELIILSERYDTAPKFFYGFKLASAYTILEDTPNYIYNLASPDLVSPGKYDPSIGISAGLFFQYPINNEFSINLEAHYNFRRTVLNRDIANAEGNIVGIQTITESQQWVEIPLLVNYRIPLVQKFLLEATVGPSFHYLLTSDLGVVSVNNEINRDMLEFRNQMNVSGIIGVRGNFKQLGRNFLTVEALFQYRFINEVNENADTSQLMLDLVQSGYAEGQLKGHAVILRVGFRFPRFNPELIK